MNHKWENNKCLRCGIIRAEIKSLDEKKHEILMYQYSDNSGKSWIIKRPDCYETNNTKSVSIKNLITNKDRDKEIIKSVSIKDLVSEDKNVKKFEYSELLKHPKWQRKRLEIMQRDDFKCCLCNDEETTLNVHHKKYMNGNSPWEYDDNNFITVCEDCHWLIEKGKESNQDITSRFVLKIKEESINSKMCFFLSRDNGFNITMKNKNNEIQSSESFVSSFDNILEFLLKIKNNN
jgi:hypothetical protein